jgi:hypothetical protein
MSARATIVIVSYNTRELLRRCLASLREHAPGYPVVVVDNASADGSAATVAAEFPEVRLLRNERNVGFGAANNRALRDADTELTMLLNSDTRLESDVVDALAQTLDRHPRAAAVGCRLVSIDGSTQASVRCFPSAMHSLRRAVGIGDPLPERIAPVDAVDGAAVLLRTEAFRAVGGFDERFFLYAEDVDLCYRLSRAGWQVLYDPSVSLTHVGSGSAEAGGAEDDRRRWQAVALYAVLHFGKLEYAAFVVTRALEMLKLLATKAARSALRADPPARRSCRTAWRHLRWHAAYLRPRRLAANAGVSPSWGRGSSEEE